MPSLKIMLDLTILSSVDRLQEVSKSVIPLTPNYHYWETQYLRFALVPSSQRLCKLQEFRKVLVKGQILTLCSAASLVNPPPIPPAPVIPVSFLDPSILPSVLPLALPPLPVDPSALPSLSVVDPSLPSLPGLPLLPVGPNLPAPPVSSFQVLPLPGLLSDLPVPLPSGVPSIPAGIPSVRPSALPSIRSLIPGVPVLSVNPVPVIPGGSTQCPQNCEAKCQTANTGFEVSECRAHCLSACATGGSTGFCEGKCAGYARAGTAIVRKDVPLVDPLRDPPDVISTPAIGVIGVGDLSYDACLSDCTDKFQSAGIGFDISIVNSQCKAACAQNADAGADILNKRQLSKLPLPTPKLPLPCLPLPSLPIATHQLPSANLPTTIPKLPRAEEAEEAPPLPSLPVPSLPLSSLPLPRLPLPSASLPLPVPVPQRPACRPSLAAAPASAPPRFPTWRPS
jgi:hypothetical protein